MGPHLYAIGQCKLRESFFCELARSHLPLSIKPLVSFTYVCTHSWAFVFVSLHLCVCGLLYLGTWVLLYLCICVCVVFCISVLGYFCISVFLCVWSSVFLYLCVCGLLYFCIWVCVVFCISVFWFFCICACGLLYCISCFADNLTPLLCGHHLTVEPTARQIQIQIQIQTIDKHKYKYENTWT